jgi:hypothetical protein
MEPDPVQKISTRWPIACGTTNYLWFKIQFPYQTLLFSLITGADTLIEARL